MEVSSYPVRDADTRSSVIKLQHNDSERFRNLAGVASRDYAGDLYFLLNGVRILVLGLAELPDFPSIFHIDIPIRCDSEIITQDDHFNYLAMGRYGTLLTLHRKCTEFGLCNTRDRFLRYEL